MLALDCHSRSSITLSSLCNEENDSRDSIKSSNSVRSADSAREDRLIFKTFPFIASQFFILKESRLDKF